MKLFIFCILLSLVAVSIGISKPKEKEKPKDKNKEHYENWKKGMSVGALWLSHYFGRKQGSFKGIDGMKPEDTSPYIVAQIGPGLVTDMTIFASCGGKPMRFSEREIISGFSCRNESSYPCYKVCQTEKLGFIQDGKMDKNQFKNHMLSMITKNEDDDSKPLEEMDECFEGKNIKNDGKCMVMKNAMQCVWDSYYKSCEPESEFNKNKRLVGGNFFNDEDED